MCAGAVITATGRRKISQLGGLYKKMPLLNGFVSKSLVMNAMACIVTGILPNLVYGLTPFGSDGHTFTEDHVTQYIELFAAATVAFVMYLDHMAPHAMLTLDTDWFYHKPLKRAVSALSAGVASVFDSCYNLACRFVRNGNKYIHRPAGIIEDAGIHVPERNKGIEDDDVLQKPAGMLVATNILVGIGAAVTAVIVIF